jgi:hypothetical protein
MAGGSGWWSELFKKKEKEDENLTGKRRERKKGREGGTEEVPSLTPDQSYFCLAFCHSTPTPSSNCSKKFKE